MILPPQTYCPRCETTHLHSEPCFNKVCEYCGNWLPEDCVCSGDDPDERRAKEIGEWRMERERGGDI